MSRFNIADAHLPNIREVSVRNISLYVIHNNFTARFLSLMDVRKWSRRSRNLVTTSLSTRLVHIYRLRDSLGQLEEPSTFLYNSPTRRPHYIALKNYRELGKFIFVAIKANLRTNLLIFYRMLLPLTPLLLFLSFVLACACVAGEDWAIKKELLPRLQYKVQSRLPVCAI